MQSFTEFIHYLSKKYGDTIAFEIRRKIIKEQISYANLPKYIQQTTNFLKINNIDVGDKVLIWGLNCPEYAILLLSLFSSSRVAVPIDFRSQDETIGKIINQTAPKAIFVSKYLKSNFLKRYNLQIIIIEDLLNIINPLPIDDFQVNIDPKSSEDRIVEIVYTSGTTGEPKGVILTEKAILQNTFSVLGVMPKLKFYRTISILPLSHMFEQIIGLLLIIRMGGTIIYLPKVNSSQILSSLHENNISHLTFVPQLFNLFFAKIKQKAVENNRLSQFEFMLTICKRLPICIRKIIFADVHKLFGKDFFAFLTGGAPLNYKIACDWETMGFSIYEGYGATEVTAIATINRPGMKKLGSVGKPIDLVDLSFDSDKQIIINSVTVAQGYFNNPKKTAESFQQGVYHTGDIGKIDEAGFLHIIGRDVFKIVLASGEKIYVEDLEAKINTHPFVLDSCVVETNLGNSHEAYAYVIIDKVKSNANQLPNIIKDINQTLDSKQQIRNYAVWTQDDFPRTHTLKINRNLVKQSLSTNPKSGIDKESMMFGLRNQNIDVSDVIANVSGINVDRLKDNDNLSTDLEMDSISRIELVSQIEEYIGILINETEINSKTTIRDIKRLVDDGNKTNNDFRLSNWQFTSFGKLVCQIAKQVILFPIHSLYVKIAVEGIENLDNIHDGYIASFNHAGILDGVCIERVLSHIGKHNFITLASKNFWLKKELINRLTRFGLELFSGGMPLYEKGFELIRVLQKSSDLLTEGYVMLYAPQGKLQRSNIQDSFSAGIGYVAKELQKPIVPFKILGYENIWPSPKSSLEQSNIRNLFPKKRGEVIVKIGKPIYALAEMSPQEIANLLEEKYNEL